jgi:uncharacterized pyridoxamine 5'-phosphate oxidase family protein
MAIQQAYKKEEKLFIYMERKKVVWDQLKESFSVTMMILLNS